MSENEAIEIYLNGNYDVTITEEGIAITDGETDLVELGRDDVARLMAILSRALLGPVG